jgi:hypothetical protein
MSLIPDNCIEYYDYRKICSAYENGKRYTLNNLSNCKVKKVKIDGCIKQQKGEKRCDFLMSAENESVRRAIFVELKGNNFIKAFKQIYSTILYLQDEFRNHQIDVRIVGSGRVTGLKNEPIYRTLAKEILPRGGTINIATNNIYTENI